MTVRDHPIALARTRVGMGQTELARRAGMGRASVVAIEDGRTRTPSPSTLATLAPLLRMDVSVLEAEITQWRARRTALPPALSNTQLALLRLSPRDVEARYESFQGWRMDLAPSARVFASLVGVSHSVITRYEGEANPSRAMSAAFAHALVRSLKVSPEYVATLASLPRHDGGEA